MPARDQSFQEVLAAAIDDLLANGFDSMERIERWTRELRAAAERSLVSPASLEQQLRDGLAAIYRRMVDQGGILKFNQGVERFTLDKVKPALRAELDRRTMASANLIRLNRAESIEKTLRRFQGWSTSIPPGGVSGETRVEVKKTVRKSLASLPFEERRVLIDQGHKMTAAISEIIASDGGAIAGRWRSHWRQANYNYRPDHKERDEQVYLIRDSWAHAAGLVRKGSVGYYDEVTAVGQEPFCFPGDSTNVSAEGVEAAYRRAYDGEICTIFFADGPSLRATPNHPVLTTRGWKPIGDIQEADHVFKIDDKAIQSRKRHDHHRVPLIAEVFASLRELGVSEVRGGKLEQFHGDGTECDVDIVRAARPLRFGIDTSQLQSSKKFGLTMPHLCGLACRTLKFFVHSCIGAASSLMRSGGQLLTTVGAFAVHPDEIGVAAVSDRAASLPDDVSDDLARHLKLSGQTQDACAALVRDAHPCRVLRIERSHFSGHVYNLQTESDWYIANGVIVHNCRCYMIWLYNLRDLPADMLTAKGKAALGDAQARARADTARADAHDPAPRPGVGYEGMRLRLAHLRALLPQE